MKKLLIMIVLLSLTVFNMGLTYADPNTNSPIVLQEGQGEELIVGIYENMPLVGMDDAGNATGFFVSLMKDFGRVHKLNVRFELATLKENFDKFEAGEVDLVLAIAETPERSQKYAYNHEIIFINYGQVYTHADQGIEVYQDLTHAIIGVEKNDVHNVGPLGIRSTLENFGVPATFKEYDTREAIFEDLAEGILDAGVVSGLYGEINKLDYDVIATTMQFNPIDIKIIGLDRHQGILDAFDAYILKQKSVSDSLYNMELKAIWGLEPDFYVPENVKIFLGILLAILIAAFVAIITSRKIIHRQNQDILRQNDHLKKLLNCIATLSDSRDMSSLWKLFVTHTRKILRDESVELVSIIKYEDGYYVDTEEFVTGGYLDQVDLNLRDTRLPAAIHRIMEEMILNKQQIHFDDQMIMIKYDSSHRVEGFVYIETSTVPKEKEFLSIYLINLLAALQGIILNNFRIEEKTKLLITLGEMIEQRDQYVANHVKRVAEATTYLAKACGCDGEDLHYMTIASSVHDIGKIFVPDDILNKPGRLTTEEFDAIKLHATDQFSHMIKDEVGLSRMVHNVVRYHHENWDGTGYPEGLRGKAIPLEARLTSIIDVFEALTHKRAYKESWTYGEALDFIVAQTGKKFDPEIVPIFVDHSEAIYQIFSKLPDDYETLSIK